MSYKRRIPHDIVQLALVHYIIPVYPQGIAFDDIRVRLQREKVQLHVDNVLCFFEHLVLGDPQCCPGDRDSEIVDLNAVELADGNLDRREAFIAKGDLAVGQQAKDLVLQLPKL